MRYGPRRPLYGMQYKQAQLPAEYDWGPREIAIFDNISFDFILKSAVVPFSVSGPTYLEYCSSVRSFAYALHSLSSIFQDRVISVQTVGKVGQKP